MPCDPGDGNREPARCEPRAASLKDGYLRVRDTVSRLWGEGRLRFGWRWRRVVAGEATSHVARAGGQPHASVKASGGALPGKQQHVARAGGQPHAWADVPVQRPRRCTGAPVSGPLLAF